MSELQKEGNIMKKANVQSLTSKMQDEAKLRNKRRWEDVVIEDVSVLVVVKSGRRLSAKKLF